MIDYLKLVIIAGIFAAGATSGSLITYKIQRGNVLALELTIEKSNQQALLQQKKIEQATKDAIKLNNTLDQSHEAAINSINSVHDELDATIKRLLRDNRQAINDLPASATPGQHQEHAANGTLFSEKLEQTIAEFLPSEALRADQAAIDKNTLLDFVKNNCGISP